MIQVATIISFGELGFGGFLSQWAGCDRHKLSYCCHAEVWDLFGEILCSEYDKDQVHTKTAVNITNSPRLRFDLVQGSRTLEATQTRAKSETFLWSKPDYTIKMNVEVE